MSFGTIGSRVVNKYKSHSFVLRLVAEHGSSDGDVVDRIKHWVQGINTGIIHDNGSIKGLFKVAPLSIDNLDITCGILLRDWDVKCLGDEDGCQPTQLVLAGIAGRAKTAHLLRREMMQVSSNGYETTILLASQFQWQFHGTILIKQISDGHLGIAQSIILLLVLIPYFNIHLLIQIIENEITSFVPHGIQRIFLDRCFKGRVCEFRSSQ
mmetsp:Transcript_43914/g.92412  ORF Transcript_43914/g.92412 Transcript_43914/m.92412 type:complete len:210 (-) Transcript_43914:1144-1773(-)